MSEETKKSSNYILPAILGIALVAIGIYVYGNANGSMKSLPAKSAAERAIKLINTNIKPKEMPDYGYESVKENKGMYELVLKITNPDDKKVSTTSIFITKDGNWVVPIMGEFLDLTKKPADAEAQQQQETQAEIPKTDKPEVRMFVMSYCPFGLQAEKMYLPVYNLLKDKAAMEIDYVSYIMHGFKEAEQNVRQYCIERDQKNVFSKYLDCFVKTDDHAKCAAQAGVDTGAMNACYADTMTKYNIKEDSTAFDIHKDLNTKYGVQGSPTIVINGVEAKISNRSPEEFKKWICDAFNTKPAECDQKLSEAAASTGIGEGTGSASSGSCN